MEEQKTMKQEYDAAMKGASVMALIQVVGRHPTATLGEVADLAKKEGISGISVGQLFAEDRPKTGAEWANGQGSQGKKSLSESDVNTRTVAARDEYDASILRVLRASPNHWVHAPEIRAACGGTPLQVRTALNRLVVLAYVEYDGVARATAYRVKLKS